MRIAVTFATYQKSNFMRTPDDYAYLLSWEDHISRIVSNLNNDIFPDIDQRLKELEYACLKYRKKPEVARTEKSAILHELGVFEYLKGLNIPQGKLAALLSVVYDNSTSNIEKDLSSSFNGNASFKNRKTYQSLVKRFEELELDDYVEKSQQVLDKMPEK